ncbi:MAG TPA: homogentisate 1,2-dioxygenase [Dehalococcoidia bacterium]|nr:homogentisate 1,2-dioxygenase [Dehalococcoidia bacterium]
MPFYQRVGRIPRKRHTQFRQPDGSFYHEELFGTEGFSGISSLLYHLRPPTLVQEIQARPPVPVQVWEQDVHRHHLFRTVDAPSGGDAYTGRHLLFYNDDVTFSIARPTDRMDYFFRNARQDELYFVHEGSGQLLTQFGRIEYGPGDYLNIPRGTTYQVQPGGDPQRMVVIESSGFIQTPKRFRNGYGQFLEWSPFCERDLRAPADLETRDEAGEFEIRVKVGRTVSSYCYHHHPFDLIGWDGLLFPYAFNIKDYEPITGRIHQPPPVHQVFEAPGFVVCNFVPRKVDYHPEAIPAPYNHSNIDSDEVLYFVGGNFLGRKSVEACSITLHPGGIPHGPKPGGLEASLGMEATEETAVMMDTFRPLHIAASAEKFDVPEYPYAWLPRDE